jgi:hypothetical protein
MRMKIVRLDEERDNMDIERMLGHLAQSTRDDRRDGWFQVRRAA